MFVRGFLPQHDYTSHLCRLTPKRTEGFRGGRREPPVAQNAGGEPTLGLHVLGVLLVAGAEDHRGRPQALGGRVELLLVHRVEDLRLGDLALAAEALDDVLDGVRVATLDERAHLLDAVQDGDGLHLVGVLGGGDRVLAEAERVLLAVGDLAEDGHDRELVADHLVRVPAALEADVLRRTQAGVEDDAGLRVDRGGHLALPDELDLVGVEEVAVRRDDRVVRLALVLDAGGEADDEEGRRLVAEDLAVVLVRAGHVMLRLQYVHTDGCETISSELEDLESKTAYISELTLQVLV